MPDGRRHRGPHPEDDQLFARSQVQQMRQAVVDYCYLLDRGYAPPSSLKLVGDRYRLRERQRTAINRSTCTQLQAQQRTAKHVSLDGSLPVAIDGFNLLTTIESALAGGVIIIGREGCVRDMASMHGSYRRVEETQPSIELAGDTIVANAHSGNVPRVRWLLDQPVSNSGRLAEMLREIAAQRNWPWEVEVVPDPDPLLAELDDHVVVTADREILDRCARWHNLAADIIAQLPDCRTVRLGAAADSEASR